jgi:hypothetical protein
MALGVESITYVTGAGPVGGKPSASRGHASKEVLKKK